MQNPMAAQQLELANQPIVEVHEWDNHDVHIAIHERFMKGQEYEMLPDPIKNEFELHLKAHKDMQFKTLMEKQMKQQMAAGQPGDPNAPQGGDPNGGPPSGAPSGPGNQFSGIEQPPVDAGQPPQ